MRGGNGHGQVTDFEWPTVQFRSQWGLVDNLFWSKREADRIARKGKIAFVAKNGSERVAVFVGAPTAKCVYVGGWDVVGQVLAEHREN